MTPGWKSIHLYFSTFRHTIRQNTPARWKHGADLFSPPGSNPCFHHWYNLGMKMNDDSCGSSCRYFMITAWNDPRGLTEVSAMWTSLWAVNRPSIHRKFEPLPLVQDTQEPQDVNSPSWSKLSTSLRQAVHWLTSGRPVCYPEEHNDQGLRQQLPSDIILN
jgi:hypothetical protein